MLVSMDQAMALSAIGHDLSEIVFAWIVRMKCRVAFATVELMFAALLLDIPKVSRMTLTALI